MLKIEKGYSFDDLLLVPSYSELTSREQASIKTKISSIELDIPIISSPMDTVTEYDMAMFMWQVGGMGIVHRYNTIEEQASIIKSSQSMVEKMKDPKPMIDRPVIGAAIGINGDAKDRAKWLVSEGVDLLVIDIAHGDMKQAYDMVEWIKDTLDVLVMSGNIVTSKAAYRYISSGADILRVGVGPGSACSTRLVAGVGYPQISAIDKISKIRDEVRQSSGGTLNVSIVSDGGIKHSGDVVKALAAGADAVILGGLLSGFEVSAGGSFKFPTGDGTVRTLKQFRGMASDSALSDRGTSGYLIEGESFLVDVQENQEEWMVQFTNGIKAGMAYLGARDIEQLRNCARFVEVTVQGQKEGTPHFNLGGK